MGLRPVAIDNANEKGRDAFIEYPAGSPCLPGARRPRIVSQIPITIFARSRVDECSGLDDGLRVRMVGGVNEIVDTLGVNEGLEGEG